MKANSDKSKQSNKATRRVLAGVLCGASVLSLVLSLVMPPISRAIANDAQAVSTEKTVMGGGSSSESTDVENTNNGDTENQNSDDAEADETGSSNDVEQNQAEDQLEDEQRGEDGETSDDNAVKAAAEGGQTETASGEIDSAEKLKTELEKASDDANFKLTKDIVTSETIQLNKSGSNITLDLNGCKIKHTSSNLPLFNITGGATLTVKDGQQAAAKEISANQENKCGNLASMEYGDSNIPTKLTYYVTESVASGTVTNETLKAYEAGIKGAIVACSETKAAGLRLVNLFNGGHFNFESGVLTQKKDGQIGNLIYAENGSTVNMSGGYVCGASGSGNGAGIMVSNDKGDASTLKLTGGVIAGNSAYNGGGVYARYSKVTITNGIISGNSTLNEGLGGGIMAEGGIVTVSGGYITNNRMAKFCDTDGSGCHGGAGLAANNGVHVTISGGQITGNYSEEAGGGVYVTNLKQGGMAWLDIKGGYIASNVSYRSEGAGIRVGQRVDAMINGTPDNNDTPGSKVYITNNHCMSRFDWGGGGIFVQGCKETPSDAGRLFVYSSYISSNTAGGYGGGVAVCPTGKTLVTNTEGTAIFDNKSAGNEFPGKDHPNPAYKQEGNSGNDKAPHLSKGGDGKNQDYTAYLEPFFRDNGHADFFLAAHDHNTPIAVVTGKMLGGGDARYTGSIELKKAINIPANGAVGVENSIGLTSGVKAGDEAAINAQNEATTFITGNYSWDHGGGIMSNGDLYLGVPADTYVYPSLKLKATKELDGRDLKDGEFTFTVYRKDSDTAKAPSWDNNGNFSNGGCELVESAQNNAGNIAFDLSEKLSEQFKASGTGETTDYDITYYMVENAGDELGVKYDHAVYEIKVKVKCTPTELMSVPIQGKPDEVKKLMVYNYTIDRVDVTKHDEGSAKDLDTVSPDTDGYYSIVDSSSATSTNKATFTNTYTSPGSWTPKATKVVEGGEMKEFTLQLAKDSSFKDEDIVGAAVTSGNNKEQTLSFKDVTDKDKTIELKYSLSDITANPDTAGDSSGRGASKTFYYYVCEKNESSAHPHYKFDPSVYRFKVVATDDTEGHIGCAVTYRKGTVGSDGKWVADANSEDHDLTDTSTPTFINTYSTSLPLSGMSGVTLTYLAGAAVLCVAAAWMHIRRKANAKGGERRE
uniref:Spy0128 family protein n=1 Tax=Collinsella sp. TaxID=1965294 RepID=UPI003FEE3362